ncbi:hypothetical protein SZN_09381 [Streptomyces zinciresistens K42]|uniref:Uncharacterized protein n=1 Tax=Streptomyces zinciresistens K42 TaxID=700597 RepID=G2G8Q8_9ACTN|nr:hypothetical protein [Streptomyces zinciresistens]EGX60123.1 hypothetical protein SZN_09381 [Streptomyces zinciresistens K42]
MNSTAAAVQADVTVATIRTWCRAGAVAAVKQAGRWIIDAASLARRIAIGAMKRRPARTETPMIDLAAGYTVTHWTPGERTETITPVVKRSRRPRPVCGHTITVSGLAPLFADRFDAIPESDRAHFLTVFRSALIVITELPDADWAGDPQGRDDGLLRTTYRGDVPGISIADVLDLAARLRTQLAA